MLRFAEEVMLLLLDDEGERFLRVPDWSLRYALGGAVLMDLAMEDRIDSDLEKLMLVDPTPLGDDILDPVLAEIAAEAETHNPRFWVERAGASSEAIREAAIERLIQRGNPGAPGGPLPVGFPLAPLPRDRRHRRARSQAPDHGAPLQRHDSDPARRGDHLPG